MSETSIRDTPFLLPPPFLHTDSRRLAVLIERLHRHRNQPVHVEAMTDILDELSTHAFETLVREELMLASMGMALSANHTKEHVRFQEFIANHCLQASFGVNVPQELLDFLLDWWHQHVLGTDLNEIPVRTVRPDARR